LPPGAEGNHKKLQSQPKLQSRTGAHPEFFNGALTVGLNICMLDFKNHILKIMSLFTTAFLYTCM
jgi:hypothetical protein